MFKFEKKKETFECVSIDRIVGFKRARDIVLHFACVQRLTKNNQFVAEKEMYAEYT